MLESFDVDSRFCFAEYIMAFSKVMSLLVGSGL